MLAILAPATVAFDCYRVDKPWSAGRKIPVLIFGARSKEKFDVSSLLRTRTGGRIAFRCSAGNPMIVTSPNDEAG